MTLPRVPNPDERMGMVWWNGLSPAERSHVLQATECQQPGKAPSVADAWSLWKAGRISMSEFGEVDAGITTGSRIDTLPARAVRLALHGRHSQAAACMNPLLRSVRVGAILGTTSVVGGHA